MMYHFESKEELRKFIIDEVYTTAEAIDFLGVSRQALSSLIQRGKLNPIKKEKTIQLFFKSELEERKKDAAKLKKKYRPYE